MFSAALQFRPHAITNREREILDLLHLTHPEIARILGISTGTVKMHIKHICIKLGAESSRHAVVLWLRKGSALETACAAPSEMRRSA